MKVAIFWNLVMDGCLDTLVAQLPIRVFSSGLSKSYQNIVKEYVGTKGRGCSLVKRDLKTNYKIIVFIEVKSHYPQTLTCHKNYPFVIEFYDFRVRLVGIQAHKNTIC